MANQTLVSARCQPCGPFTALAANVRLILSLDGAGTARLTCPACRLGVSVELSDRGTRLMLATDAQVVIDVMP